MFKKIVPVILTIMLVAVASALAMQDLITYPKFRAVDSNGEPYAGGYLYTYIAGTLTTKTTYSDHGKTSPNTNPIVLDSNGEAMVVPGEGCYRMILKDSSGVTIWDIDNICGMLGPVVVTTYASESAIQGASGNVDGEMAIDAATGNQYTWDDGNTKWRVAPNNIYTADPSSSTYTIETGTQYYNTTTSKLRVWNGSSWSDVIATSFTSASTPGAVFSRPTFVYKDADEIYIKAFAIHHQGTSEQIVYSDSQLTFQFGSGGSNSSSDDLANNDWFYVYIDDSAVSSGGDAIISASELIDLTEEPVWDNSKHAWVGQTDSNDRCIGAVYTDGSAQIREFYQAGRYVTFADYIATNISATSIGAAWGTYATLVIPKFTTMANISALRSSTSYDLMWKTYGASATTGHYLIWTYRKFNAPATVITDSSQRVDLYSTGTQNITIYTDGYWLPDGF